jgi:hypothetical protein
MAQSVRGGGASAGVAALVHGVSSVAHRIGIDDRSRHSRPASVRETVGGVPAFLADGAPAPHFTVIFYGSASFS